MSGCYLLVLVSERDDAEPGQYSLLDYKPFRHLTFRQIVNWSAYYAQQFVEPRGYRLAFRNYRLFPFFRTGWNFEDCTQDMLIVLRTETPRAFVEYHVVDPEHAASTGVLQAIEVFSYGEGKKVYLSTAAIPAEVDERQLPNCIEGLIEEVSDDIQLRLHLFYDQVPERLQQLLDRYVRENWRELIQ